MKGGLHYTSMEEEAGEPVVNQYAYRTGAKVATLFHGGALVVPGSKDPQAALLHAQKEAGWDDCGRIHCREYSTKRHIFAHPEMNRLYTKSDLRRMVEDESVASDDRKVQSIR